jgi:hypothetical protein
MEEALPSNTEKKYRATIDTDFDDNGNGKQDLKFYESNNGTTVNEPSILVTDPTKEKMANYVVEVVPGDEAATPDPDPAAVVDVDEGEGEAEPAAASTHAVEGGNTQLTDEKQQKILESVVGKSLELMVRDGEITKEFALNQPNLTDEQKEIISKIVVQKAAPAAVDGPAKEQGGGRRRTKRKGRKGSRKSRKGAKKGAKKSKKSSQSQNGGRRRSSKNRRKHSHRSRKH